MAEIDLKSIRGATIIFGDHINTDNIIPSQYLDNPDPKYYSQYIMTGIDTKFPQKVKNIREKYYLPVIIVAGENWASGSSREQAAEGLKHGGIAAVIAESFGTIFFRNACNVGLPLVVLPGCTQILSSSLILSIDMINGCIIVEGDPIRKISFTPLEDFLLNRIKHGGLLPELKKLYGKNIS